MTLGRRQQLEIVEIAFFVPSFFAALFAAYRQGRGRLAGWALLAALCAVRISGSACEIAAYQGASDPVGLKVAYVVLNGIGLSFAISSVLRILERVNEHMDERIPPRIARFINLPLLVGIIVSIVGGNKATEYDNPDRIHDSADYFKAASILYLIVCLGTVALTIWLSLRLLLIAPTERRFVYGCAACLPLLFVWTIYGVISSFNPTSSAFNRNNPSVWAQAFMVVLEEFIILLILLPIGMLTPPPPTKNRDRESKPYSADPESASGHDQGQTRSARPGPLGFLIHFLS